MSAARQFRRAEEFVWRPARLTGGGLRDRRAGEGGNFSEVKTHNEHWTGRYAAPAEKIPLGANEPDFRLQGEIENLARVAAIKALRHHQQRLRAPVLTVSRAPDGNVDRLLLDLIGDDHGAEKCARLACADVMRLPFPVRPDARARGNQVQFHRHFRHSPQCSADSNTCDTIDEHRRTWIKLTQ